MKKKIFALLLILGLMTGCTNYSEEKTFSISEINIGYTLTESSGAFDTEIAKYRGEGTIHEAAEAFSDWAESKGYVEVDRKEYNLIYMDYRKGNRRIEMFISKENDKVEITLLSVK